MSWEGQYFSPNWTKGQDIIKFKCGSKTFIKFLLEPMKETMNSWSCPVIPFGLTNAPSSFQALMNQVFKQFFKKFVLVFFDNILAYSKDWKDHLSHLREVLQLLRANQLYAKQSKCNFDTTQVEYLSHVIAASIVSMDKSKVEKVLTWPVP